MWCLRGKRDGNFAKDGENHRVRAICGVLVKNRKRALYLMLLDLYESMDQLAIANSMR